MEYQKFRYLDRIFVVWVALAIWTLLVGHAGGVAHESQYCEVSRPTEKFVTAKCGDIVTQAIAGYSVDKTQFKEYDDTVLQSLMNKWISQPERSPPCKFKKTQVEKVKGCCSGYTGDLCNQPICLTNCSNGGVCIEPNKCHCIEPYFGVSCHENREAITPTLQYCYRSSGCDGALAKNFPDVVEKTECCAASDGFAWGECGATCSLCPGKGGSGQPDEYTPDKPHVVINPGNLPFRTCMGNGPNYYRTLDGLEFLFPGRCKYTVFSDGLRSVVVLMVNCHSYAHCKKVHTIRLNNHDTVTAAGDNITVNGHHVTVTESGGYATGAVHIEKRGLYYYLEYGSFRFRWNNGSTWFLTLEDDVYKNRRSPVKGICGNFDGVATNDLQKPSGEQAANPIEFGNSWKVFNEDAQCPDASGYKYPCSNKDSENAAIKDCGALKRGAFRTCHDAVDVSHYYIRCISDYCEALESPLGLTYGEGEKMNSNVKEALCLTLTAYSQACASQHIFFEWRCPELCPAECPSGTQYVECMPRCVRTCNNLYSILPDSCDTVECYPGCVCPQGHFLHDGKCLEPAACPCQYQGQFYEPGKLINIGCNKCTCDSGRWECSDDICSKTCAVLGFQHFETFDGMRYEFHGPPCNYVLVELNSKAASNPTFLGKGELTVSYRVGRCIPNLMVSCTESVSIIYRREKEIFVVDMDKDFVVKINGEKLADPKLKPFANRFLYVKRITSLFLMVEGFGFRILYDKRGMICIALDPFYANNVRGMCGNMDGSVADDLTSRNDIEEQLIPFAMSYSDCTTRSKEAVINQDTCGLNHGASQHATSVCQKVGDSHVFSNCLKRIVWGRYREYCIEDACADTTSHVPVCTMISAMAAECLANGDEVDWMADPDLKEYCQGVDGYSTTGGRRFGQCSPRLQTCRDLQLQKLELPFYHEQDCFAGSYCDADQLEDDSGACKARSSCTCYDQLTDKNYEPGQTTFQGCTNCVCTNGEWDCGGIECDTSVRCPANQRHRKNAPSCGTTCATYGHCTGKEPLVDGCSCEKGLVQLGNGTCVRPDRCPCTYNLELHEPDETVQVGCKIYRCSKRRWDFVRAIDCKGVCTASGDPHYLTFDGHRYSYQGSCEYILVRQRDARGFWVTSENVPCGTTGVTCTRSVKMTVNGVHVNLVQGKDPMVNNVSVGYLSTMSFPGGHITGTGLFIAVIFDCGLQVLWDTGTRIYIYLSGKHRGQVEGLCGDFDGNYLNDFQDLSNGHIASTPAGFARLFKISPTCPDPDLPQDFNPCTVNPNRADWAKTTCRIIKEGSLFEECRSKVINYDDFYKECLYDACGCDKGGDCECMCTAVAAFATECYQNGVYVQWRSRHFCPVMCEKDRVYEPCGTPCKQTCQDPTGQKDRYCRDVGCVEGCFCPPGKVEGHDGECTEISSCKCMDEGKEYPPGTAITINCQHCVCINGSFSCSGTSCGKACAPTEFTCLLAQKCIPLKYRCDKIFDCDDQSDEYSCTYTCAPNQFSCLAGGQCISKELQCNGNRDCADGSDEAGDDCYPYCKGENFFQCDSRRCIISQFVCDGHNDCGAGDDSDERNCTKCEKDYFRCNTKNKCLPANVRCDGHDDCGDGSDEVNCNNTTVHHPQYTTPHGLIYPTLTPYFTTTPKYGEQVTYPVETTIIDREPHWEPCEAPYIIDYAKRNSLSFSLDAVNSEGYLIESVIDALSGSPKPTVSIDSGSKQLSILFSVMTRCPEWEIHRFQLQVRGVGSYKIQIGTFETDVIQIKPPSKPYTITNTKNGRSETFQVTLIPQSRTVYVSNMTIHICCRPYQEPKETTTSPYKTSTSMRPDGPHYPKTTKPYASRSTTVSAYPGKTTDELYPEGTTSKYYGLSTTQKYGPTRPTHRPYPGDPTRYPHHETTEGPYSPRYEETPEGYPSGHTTAPSYPGKTTDDLYPEETTSEYYGPSTTQKYGPTYRPTKPTYRPYSGGPTKYPVYKTTEGPYSPGYEETPEGYPSGHTTAPSYPGETTDELYPEETTSEYYGPPTTQKYGPTYRPMKTTKGYPSGHTTAPTYPGKTTDELYPEGTTSEYYGPSTTQKYGRTYSTTGAPYGPYRSTSPNYAPMESTTSYYGTPSTKGRRTTREYTLITKNTAVTLPYSADETTTISTYSPETTSSEYGKCAISSSVYYSILQKESSGEGYFGWIEKDGVKGDMATSDDEMVHYNDEVEEDVTVHITACLACVCHNGKFDCNEGPDRTWTSPADPCQRYSCENGHEQVVNLRDHCVCRPDELQLITGTKECCTCVPRDKATLIPCKLFTSRGPLIVYDESNELCTTSENITITSCNGFCDGGDTGSVSFLVDRDWIPTKHTERTCHCCTGHGRWAIYDVLCGHERRRRRVAKEVFDTCLCSACEGSKPEYGEFLNKITAI